MIREHVFGSQHPKTIDTREHLRVVLAALGQAKDGAQPDMAQQEPAETEGK